MLKNITIRLTSLVSQTQISFSRGKGLIKLTFGTVMNKIVLSKLFKDLIKWFKQFWFECLTKARLQLIEIENKVESDIEREKRFEPVYQEKEINNELQTGESRGLGGEMRLAAKWVIEAEEEMERKQP